MPEMKTEGAIGFDVAIRAVVSPSEMDPVNPVLRKTLFDFENVPKDNPYIERHITVVPGQSGNTLAYQMEAGVLVYNRNPHPFLLHKDMRIAQVIFQYALIPKFILISSPEELSGTHRGVGGFGSTGIK